jgi:hypothetical protein
MKLPHFVRPGDRGAWQVYTDYDSQGEQIGPIIRFTALTFEQAQNKANELDNHDY